MTRREHGAEARKQRSKSLAASIIELVIIVAVALGLALAIQAFIVKPYKIPSGSMEPTLSIGQRVLVNRIGMDFGGPSVGQIVVFHPPEGADSEHCGRSHVAAGEACPQPVDKKSSVNFIKRVVAGPGDEMYIKEGHVYRKAKGTSQFVREKDSYIRECGAEPRVHLPQADQDSRRALVHDGRQPWRIGRQQVLGTGSHLLDHRRGLLHLLAHRPHRPHLRTPPGGGGSRRRRRSAAAPAARPRQRPAPVRV